MSLKNMFEELQKREIGKLIIIEIGSFYIAGGKDAILLNRKLGLKLTCMEKQICKIGFPINALEKYLEQIEKEEYSYIVYKYYKEKVEIEEIKKYEGKNTNEIKEENIGCLECKLLKECEANKYEQAVNKLYESRD